MLDPIKYAFGEYMGRYYAELSPTTKPMLEFVGRGLAKSIQWCPSRMIDSAMEMLEAWQRNDTDSSPTKPYKFPVILVAMSRDFLPTTRDFNRPLADSTHVILPEDEKERLFKIKTLPGDLRVQLVIAAQEEPTAKSIAAQFTLFASATINRRMYAKFINPIGTQNEWPVILESPDLGFSAVRGDTKNMCMLVGDLTLKCTVPLFLAPNADDENNDYSGVPGTTDPSGFLGVDFAFTNPNESKS